MEESKAFDSWAVVEVMGHNTYAGRVSEQVIAGTGFVRVDVPEVPAGRYGEGLAAFTKIIGPGSIYAITPCTEEVARRAAGATRSRPVSMVSLTAPKALAAAIDADADSNDTDDDDDVAF